MSWFNGGKEFKKVKKDYEEKLDDDLEEDEDDDIKALKEEIACLKKQADANVQFLQDVIIHLINQPRSPLVGRNITTLSAKEISRGITKLDDKEDMKAGPKGKLP